MVKDAEVTKKRLFSAYNINGDRIPTGPTLAESSSPTSPIVAGKSDEQLAAEARAIRRNRASDDDHSY